MLRFEPPEIRQQLAEAIAKLDDVIAYGWYELNDPDFNPAEYSDAIITRDTIVDECTLPSHEDFPFTVRVSDLIEWADALTQYSIKNRSILRMKGKTLMYVEPIGNVDNGILRALSAGELELSSAAKIDGANYPVKLITGLTVFGILIEAQGKNDRDFISSFYSSTAYVQVEHPQNASEEAILSIVKSFLFELSATANQPFSIQSYPSIDEVEFPEADEAPHPKIDLRPLVVGLGLTDLHQLFVGGCGANPHDYALIHFVKVIEYVSATVVKMARHEALRKRLCTRVALTPDATFLDELAELVEEQRIFSKDAEAIKITLHTCCDALILAEHAPKHLEQFRKLRLTSDAKQKKTLEKAAIDEFSSCLSATRNQLSHAKANYEFVGTECPPEELFELTVCAMSAAEQVIRWFARLPEENRVV